MRKSKPTKQKPAPQPRESAHGDQTPALQKLWIDLGSATYNATSLGVPRAAVVATMLEIAEGICQAAQEYGDDMSSLEGLL